MPRQGVGPLVQKRIDGVMFIHGGVQRNDET